MAKNALIIKEKIDKMEYIKINNLSLSKITIKSKEMSHTPGDSICNTCT